MLNISFVSRRSERCDGLLISIGRPEFACKKIRSKQEVVPGRPITKGSDLNEQAF
jgi:hypothetical protein